MDKAFYTDEDFAKTGELSAIESVLSDFGNEMQEGLQKELSKTGKYGTTQIDSANLYQSINFNAEVFGSIFKFQLKLADYYDYVNKGVKGYKSSLKSPNSPYRFGIKQPPVTSQFKLWARKRQLNPFAVARAIRDKGTEGSGFYDKVVTPQRLKKLQRDLTKASAEDVQVLIEYTAKGVFGKTK
jgi:hypothetical protein